MFQGFALNRCCVCGVWLGPDDWDGICTDCDIEEENSMYMTDYERKLCEDHILLLMRAVKLLDDLQSDNAPEWKRDFAAVALAKTALLEKCKQIRKDVAEYERTAAEKEAEYA